MVVWASDLNFPHRKSVLMSHFIKTNKDFLVCTALPAPAAPADNAAPLASPSCCHTACVSSLLAQIATAACDAMNVDAHL